MWIPETFQTLSVYALALSSATTAQIPDGAPSSTPSMAPQTAPPKSVVALAGQMTQVQLSQLVNLNTFAINQTAASIYAKQNIGSLFDGLGKIVDGKFNLNVAQWRKLLGDLQAIWKKEGADPFVFGIDSVHGANYVRDAVILGHQINIGATFNVELAYSAGQVTAEETLAAGISLIFGPVLDLATEKLWSRVQETLSECPLVTSVLGRALIKGLQSTKQTAACAKHFLAYSENKFDRSDVQISAFNLKNYYARPYQYAIQVGVKSIMEGYISINRVPIIGSKLYLDVILREKLGFTGVLISDYREVYNQDEWHKTSVDGQSSAEMSLSTSLDINMEATSAKFPNQIQKALDKKKVTVAHLQKANDRIRKLKSDLGLYKNALPGEEFVAKFRSKEHLTVALNIARESIVLLKNDKNILPLNPNAKVFLTGAAADDIGLQCGAWTIEWQGVKEDNSLFKNGISYKQGISALGKSVQFFPGIKVNTTGFIDLAKSTDMAKNSDVILLTIAEVPGTEKPADSYDLSFDKNQLDYARELKKTGKPMILILVTNRPRLLNGLVEQVDGVINTMLPGEMGGQALGEIIFGTVNPSGKSPYTYPKFQSLSDLVYYAPVDLKCVGYATCLSEFPFGFGLSYTTFNYTNLKLSKTNITRKETVHVTVTVTNTGRMEGKEVVFLYLIQPVRTIATPENRMVKAFTKIKLAPGASKDVKFALNEDAWTVYDPERIDDFKLRFEASDFYVTMSGQVDCKAGPNAACAKFTVS